MTAGRVHYKTMFFDSDRWDDVTLRSDDIIISTPPKCGTTWTQMICALLIFGGNEFPAPLDVMSPWIEMQTRPIADIVSDIDAQTHRRFLKSHTPYDGLPVNENVTYICVGRDPRDVFLSWDNHLDNTDVEGLFTARFNAVGLDDIMDKIAEGPPERLPTEIERFWAWVEDERDVNEAHSLATTLEHIEGFWPLRDDPNVILLHYDDLQNDLEGEMRRVAARLRVTIPDDRWPELVACASFTNMKRNADVTTPESTSKIWLDNAQFFNKGTSGQWRRLLNDDDVVRYFDRCAAVASPDVIAWAHRS